MLLPRTMTIAALVLSTGCGGSKPSAPADIPTMAPVTNYRPSGAPQSVELSWSPARGVDHYQVTVAAADGAVLWNHDAPSPPVMFEVGDARGDVTWQVEGFAGDTLRARSAKIVLRLAPLAGTTP